MRSIRSSIWLGSFRLLLVLLALAALGAGCGAQEQREGSAGGGTGGGGSPPGSAIKPTDFKGARLTVGSKEFTEQLVLGQITVEALKAGGAFVRDSTGLKGSETARKALTSGEIDMYWEYTGTAQLVYLKKQPTPDARKQYQSVAKADRADGITWLEPAPANNAYAIGARREIRRTLDVTKLSQLENLVRTNPRDAGLCIAPEFARRPDGLAGLERTYGFDYPSDLVVTLSNENEIYGEIERGARCAFGEVFLTDGRIAGNELYVLEDDKGFSTTYNPCLTISSAVLRRTPELEELFDAIAGKLDTDTLRGLNAQVDLEGRRPDEVARAFLEDNGFTG